jgi:hypothetical protein
MEESLSSTTMITGLKSPLGFTLVSIHQSIQPSMTESMDLPALTIKIHQRFRILPSSRPRTLGISKGVSNSHPAKNLGLSLPQRLRLSEELESGEISMEPGE